MSGTEESRSSRNAESVPLTAGRDDVVALLRVPTTAHNRSMILTGTLMRVAHSSCSEYGRD